MEIQEAMTGDLVTVPPQRTLREAAGYMAERNCGSVVVIDPEQPGPGIFTERDLLRCIASGKDPNREVVADHLTRQGRFAAPEWSMEQAARVMIEGGFRHLVVVDEGEPLGIVSMRDIVRLWTRES